MSLQSLLESANPYTSLQSDAARLAKKWDATGLLEGLEGSDKSSMSIILENQAKQLVVEQSSTGGGTASQGTFTAGVGEQYATVALPLVRKVFGQIAAKEFVSVQPMNLPSGLVFYLDFQYGTTKKPFTSGESLYGSSSTAEDPFGNTNDGGLYGAGRFGYSVNNTASVVTGTTSSADWSDVNFDSDFSASATGDLLTKIAVPRTSLVNLDTEAIRSFRITGSNLTAAENNPQFTTIDATNVNFIITTTDASVDNEYGVEYSL